MKRCSSCGEVKEAFAFSKRRASRDGRRSQCKQCDRRDSAGRVRDPDQRRSSNAQYRLRLKEDKDRLESHRVTKNTYNDANREANRARAKQWRLENIDRERARANSYYSARYESDPLVAARRRARTILGRSAPVSQLPKELIEAKAAQLMAHRFITKGK